MGLEPTHLSATDFESATFTNYVTLAYLATALGLEPRHRLSTATNSFQGCSLCQLGLGCQIKILVLRDGLEPSFPDYQPDVLTDCTNGVCCRTVPGSQPLRDFLKGVIILNKKILLVRRQGIEPCAC